MTRAEGGEQGDLLMPFLFCIGNQGAMKEVATALFPYEQVCASFDDVKVLCELLAATLLRVAGIQLHQEKTTARIPLEGIEDSGPEVRQPGGMTVLGTSIGSELHIWVKMEERKKGLCEAIPTLPDLQCAWQILLQSANSRANHTMRTMPPGSPATCCHAHDEGLGNGQGVAGRTPRRW